MRCARSAWSRPGTGWARRAACWGLSDRRACAMMWRSRWWARCRVRCAPSAKSTSSPNDENEGETVEEKDKPGAEIDGEDSDESPASGRVYDIDSEDGAPVAESGDETAGEESAAGETSGGRFKISKKQILDRFAEKNSAITKLQKEKGTLEKERQQWSSERDALTAEKSALEGQLKEFKDKWLRSAAEFENYRKRTAKEWELLKQQSRTEVILEVLNSLDDFERAFAVVEPGDESDFVKGIRLIYNNLARNL